MFAVHSFILILSLSLCSLSWAATVLPKNLNAADRVRAVEILGFGSAPKVLDNPYPLGGSSGIEVGLSTEYIPLTDLATLGNTSKDKGELNFYNLSFAKGLYYNVDVHVNFTPFFQEESVQSFGSQLRWGFYEASFFPLTLSAVLYAGGSNFSNLINITTLGANILGTVNFDNVAIYFGSGRVRAIGKFIGGPEGITDDQQTTVEDIMETHTIFGLNIDMSKMFVSLEIDRYADSFYSGKIGFRF